MIRHATFLASLLFAMTALGGDVVFESKPSRTHVVELYTSEGCSSCPPAEGWLSNLKSDPRLWQDFVPLAFHVDYWDHLGWRDPFASKMWTERQADYSARWKSQSVYTPGFVLDGREWRRAALPAAGPEMPGVLQITIDGGRVTVIFKPSAGPDRAYEIHLARLGSALSANVTAGENSGRKLVHDFVVLGLTNEGMKSGGKELRLPVESSKQTGNGRSAVVAWVTMAGQIEPIQAVGGWLP